MIFVRLVPAALLATTLVVPDVALARRAQPETPIAAPAPAAAPVANPTPAPATPVSQPTAWEPPTAAPTPPAPVIVATVPPPRPVALPQPAPPPRIKGGNEMIIAGSVSAGLFYFFTSLGGAVAIDKARDGHVDPLTGKRTIDHRKLNYGRGLLIPVAGPFIAMGYTDSARQRWAAVMTGSVQVAGTVLVLAGMIRNARARRWDRMRVGAGFAQGGATVSLSGRF
jgi:hypothetical protein